jgi:ABC-type lipoprotein export system ATPase subunit
VLRIAALDYDIGDVNLFRNLALEVETGSSAVILGPSGSGKSTLLSFLLGLVRPDAGTVEIDGEDIATMSGRALTRMRASKIGMIFQFGELLPELSPVDNVALAAMLARRRDAEVYQRARELLENLGVPEAETVETLSGGERQRTAVARALMNRPKLLLADEPTGALDAKNRDNVADLLFKVPKEYDCALLVVTHDLDVAARADSVFRIDDGALRLEESRR